MISKDTLSEVRDLLHTIQVWQRLESRFNVMSLGVALDLKRMLTNISLEHDQSMDSYLRSIKTIVDALAAIQCAISDLELIQFTTTGLPKDYDSFVTTYSMLPRSTSFDDLRSKLLLFEQRIKYNKDHSHPIHQVLLQLPVIVKGKGVVPVIRTTTREIVTTVIMADVIETTRAKVPRLQ